MEKQNLSIQIKVQCMTKNELKEKLVDTIYTIIKRVPDFCPDYNQIAKNGADVIMDIIKEYNNDRRTEN